jgi:ribosomal protein S18 acetylase RimI-like enzyme
MQLKSIGLLSELFFYHHDSIVKNFNDFIKIETPDNPKYYWGNLLIFPSPPKKNDFENWIAKFNEEFGANPSIEHMTFTWDIIGEICEKEVFESNGFQFEESIVLTTNKIKIQNFNSDVTYRKILTDQDWQKVIDLQLKIGIELENYNEIKYREFLIKRFDKYKSLVNKNGGNWYGAFLGEQLVADLGLFGFDSLARYQSIETDCEFRKKGIAQSLMAFAAQDFPQKTFILLAHSSRPAIDLYMKIGFEIKEVISGFCRYK